MKQSQELPRKGPSQTEAADQQKPAAQAPDKKPFEAPRLECYDDIAQLTAMPTFNFS